MKVKLSFVIIVISIVNILIISIRIILHTLLKVTQEDFKKSKENVLYRKQEGTPEGLYM